MSSDNAHLNTLNEADRFAYLQAMEVPLWVPRDCEITEHTSLATQQVQPGQLTDSVESHTADKAEAYSTITPNSEGNAVSQAADQINSLKQSSPALEEDISQIQNKVDANETLDNASHTDSSNQVSHYLKMVPWSVGSENSQTILIVCRHQKDQPAQSFARANSPSQFMSDYIQALRELLDDENDDCFIRLGHLAQAGLGSDCVSLNEVIEQLKPKVVLLLGEETVKELYGDKDDIASLRGRLLPVQEQKAGLVSYHPFSLIKNPSLKRLALEDLKLAATVIRQ